MHGHLNVKISENYSRVGVCYKELIYVPCCVLNKTNYNKFL